MPRFIQSLVDREYVDLALSAHDSLSGFLACGLGCRCMILSAAKKNAGTGAAGLPQVWLAAASSFRCICKGAL